MLFVDHDQSQFGKFYFFFNERVRADYELGVALSDVPTRCPLSVFLQRSGQQHNAIAVLLQQLARTEIVLCSKDFGRGHEGSLITVLDRNDGCFERHQSLS